MSADGQTPTPNRNVSAPAGFGGDKWGAFGGGITPTGTPLSVKRTLSNGQRQASFDDRLGNVQTSVLADLSKIQLSILTIDMTMDNNSPEITVDSLSSTTTADSGL